MYRDRRYRGIPATRTSYSAKCPREVYSIANETAMLYTSRGHFAEYDVLVAGMPRYLRSRYIDQGALLAGRWRDALDAVHAMPPPPERPATNGADVIAAMITERLS